MIKNYDCKIHARPKQEDPTGAPPPPQPEFYGNNVVGTGGNLQHQCWPWTRWLRQKDFKCLCVYEHKKDQDPTDPDQPDKPDEEKPGSKKSDSDKPDEAPSCMPPTGVRQFDKALKRAKVPLCDQEKPEKPDSEKPTKKPRGIRRRKKSIAH